MASIEDRWFSAKPGPDGKKARKPRHGTGKRWKVHYTDPDARQRSESFDRRVDAERFKTTVEADILCGIYVDPDAGASRSASTLWRSGFPRRRAEGH